MKLHETLVGFFALLIGLTFGSSLTCVLFLMFHCYLINSNGMANNLNSVIGISLSRLDL